MQLYYLVHIENNTHSFLWQTVNRYASTMKHFCDLDLWTHDLESLNTSSHDYSIWVIFGWNPVSSSEAIELTRFP